MKNPYISMDESHTLDGEPFTLLTITKPGDYPVVGYNQRGLLSGFFIDGTYNGNYRHWQAWAPLPRKPRPDFKQA